MKKLLKMIFPMWFNWKEVETELEQNDVIKNNAELNVELDDYSPYCSICDSCGETSCCPSTCCDMGEGCKYPETNLTDLKYNYTSYHSLIKYLYENEEKYPEIIAQLGKITDEEFDKWYGE